MPTIDIAFSDTKNVKHEINLRAMSEGERRAYYQAVHDRVDERLKMLRALSDNHVQQTTMHGVRCNITADSTDQHRAIKIEQLNVALGSITKGGTAFQFPNNEVNVYCTSSKAGRSAYSNASVGFVYIDRKDTSGRFTTALILGDSVIDSQNLVAAEVEAYYQPTFTVNAKQKRALAAIYHEFGHVFHQLHHPDHYAGLCDLARLNQQVKSKASIAGHEAYRSLPKGPNGNLIQSVCDGIVDVSKQVSTYASSHPCELIAEVFSALMMGVPVAESARTAYNQLGGAQPAAGMMHVRKGQNAFKRNVLYPVAEFARSIGMH
ncbi:MAG: hypothetical protein VX589_14145 [Myxococcota bacterium]|nr:hypothetical protein [Myxococcota bacterium]